ncbi:MAG: UDP-N-acetylmuramoyl-L-alanyl-D-glutamate--2,6-diaminopimelate ligase [Verrucomicrobiota bacterium]
MKLIDLLAAQPQYRIASGPESRRVAKLRYDSRQVEAGDVFFAWKGKATDGHRYIPDVCERSAAAVVCEDPAMASGGHDVTYVLVPNARHALARMAAAYFGRPDRKLSLIGVTGTNGKTTTCFILKHLLAEDPATVGLIGTVQYEVGGRILPARRTTPESLDFHELLSQMASAGCEHVVMEASSHALQQGRLLPVDFQIGVFTNLSQDHLDYHGTLESYLEAKTLLFRNLDREVEPGVAVLNADDPAGEEIAARLSQRVRLLRYSTEGPADLSARDITFSAEGTAGTLVWEGREHAFSTPLVGSFNLSNTLAAAAAALAAGIGIEAVAARLDTVPAVPGRLERFVSGAGFTVVVDYAHTDDAVRKALASLRGITRERLIAVVGCGGDRDRFKRPKMAQAAVEGADLAIFTADNPRGEEVGAILEDMAAGVPEATNYRTIPDRREAIAEALALAGPGDVVCVAGKGHETYQEINGMFLPFDDRKVVREFLDLRQTS